jgi:hypothetical protein
VSPRPLISRLFFIVNYSLLIVNCLCDLRTNRTRSPRRGAAKCARDWRGAKQPRRSRGRSAKARSPGKPGFRRSRKCAQLLGVTHLLSLPRRGTPPLVHVTPRPPRLHAKWFCLGVIILTQLWARVLYREGGLRAVCKHKLSVSGA